MNASHSTLATASLLAGGESALVRTLFPQHGPDHIFRLDRGPLKGIRS